MAAHILIIDDDVNNTDVLSQVCALENIATSVIHQPNTIDSLIDQIGVVDFIFLDLEMPEVDGYAVFNYLKSLPQFSNVPIIAHTVHQNEITVAHDMGFSGFIGKPLDIDRFPDYLKRLLAGEQIWERGA